MSTKITINGQQYDSPEQMPPDVRQAYEQAMEKVKAGGSGVKIDTVRFAPTFTFRLGGKSNPPGAPTPPAMPGGPRPIEPSNIESGIRNFVVTVLLLVSASVAWWWWRMSSR